MQKDIWNIDDVVLDVKSGLDYYITKLTYYSDATDIQYFWANRLLSCLDKKYLSSNKCIRVGKLEVKYENY